MLIKVHLLLPCETSFAHCSLVPVFCLVSKLSNKLLFCTQCDSGALVMLFVCVDPDFSIASMADVASISHRTYFRRARCQAGRPSYYLIST